MATSSTNSFNLTAQRLIDLALMDLGVNGPAGTLDANLRPMALDMLNMVIKNTDTGGEYSWRQSRLIQTLTAGVAAYTLSNRVNDLDQPARYTQAGATYGSQVESMTRDEYMSLPDRTIQGTPFRYYSESALDANGIQFITLYLYPVPPNTGDTLEYAAILSALDVTDLGQTIDAPQKWLNVYRKALAFELAPAFNAMDRVSYLRAAYKEAVDQASNDDGERGDLQIVPFGGTSYGYQGGR